MASVKAADWQQGHKTRLKLAFCLYKYMPYGGLQRDFLRIALECQQRGHDIRVYTLSWTGDIPDGFDVKIVPVTAFTNHTLYERYHDWVRAQLVQDPVDAVVGINKMPGLDVYYAADSCYAEKAHTQRSWLYRLLPRYRHFSRYERAVFGRDSQTEILMISNAQQPFFDHYYHTQDERFQFLPPGIARDRIAPANVDEIRADMRTELGVADDEKMVLMLGSGFIKKGLGRALYAIRSLPRPVRKKTRFFVVGEDNPAPFQRQMRLLGIGRQVTILSGRDDAERFLFAADLMMLPALDEAAGIVILEAMVAGLPVLVTENCGYAHYVAEADMGRVLPMPFDQKQLNTGLLAMLEEDKRAEWQAKGKHFAETADIYSLHGHAARLIEEVALEQVETESRLKGKIAFCLFKYFPYGGLQRDFIRIASEAMQRDYQVRVYTLSWQGDVPRGFEIVIVPVQAVTNHARYQKYRDWIRDHLKNYPVDRVVGFNKMPGLDVYYAADSCYEEKAQNQRGTLYRHLPRYRLFSDFERSVFGRGEQTEILMISPVQIDLFKKYYGTEDERIHLLSPGIARDRIAPPNRISIREEFRDEFGLGPEDNLLLMVGSGFITKGLDRVLLGMLALPAFLLEKTRLIVIGQDEPGSFRKMASRLGLGSKVEFLSGRDDVPRFMIGADVLVHPAYVENTGTVLLEAVVAGLPVIATDVCGYAPYILEADAGLLVSSPYRQETFNQLLEQMITSPRRPEWQKNGLRFARTADIYDMPIQAADFICQVS